MENQTNFLIKSWRVMFKLLPHAKTSRITPDMEWIWFQQRHAKMTRFPPFENTIRYKEWSLIVIFHELSVMHVQDTTSFQEYNQNNNNFIMILYLWESNKQFKLSYLSSYLLLQDLLLLAEYIKYVMIVTSWFYITILV